MSKLWELMEAPAVDPPSLHQRTNWVVMELKVPDDVQGLRVDAQAVYRAGLITSSSPSPCGSTTSTAR